MSTASSPIRQPTTLAHNVAGLLSNVEIFNVTKCDANYHLCAPAGGGYKAQWFDREKLHRRLEGENSQNYFFLMPDHLDYLTGLGLLEG